MFNEICAREITCVSFMLEIYRKTKFSKGKEYRQNIYKLCHTRKNHTISVTKFLLKTSCTCGQVEVDLFL